MKARWLCCFAGSMACVWLASCAGHGPSVVLNTAGGTTPVYTPPGATLPPPTATVPTGSRSGTYAGTAIPLDTGGGICLNTLPVKGFHVQGRAVRLGGYRGTIDANGGVQMAYGRNWLVGQFEGDDFYGQLDAQGNFGQSCTYRVTLQRVGQ